jgi:acyl-[acyl-carrier-protein]-phospholipid O-acyltransferase/long-chain-fatty-acid--[acyl-carrier-protein] ligase
MSSSSNRLTKELAAMTLSHEQGIGTSFRFLNVCQFIGAMNDNIFKLLLAFCFIAIEGAASSNRILAMAGAIYVLPFILLSTTAGILADRYSKRTIIVITRLVELAAILFGMVALGLQNKPLSFFTLFLLASHSAIFTPCKYGIIPEIVPKEAISKANGLLTSFSYIAIIVGTFLAAFLTDITNKNFILALTICAVFSFISLLLSLKIQKTPPAGSRKKVTPRLLSELIQNIKIIRREPSLLSAVLGSAFFLFIGSYIQLNMIPFALKTLHLTDVQGGYMFLLAAFGIGAGSLTAGKLSGKAVEFGLVPFGGIGMAISTLLLSHWSHTIPIVLILVFLMGFFGGTYLVPLDSYIQVASPTTKRGQIVATTNVLGFFGVLLSALSMYVISEVIGLEPDQGFAIVGVATLIIAISISISISGYIVRFFSLITSYVFFPAYLKGKEQVPLDKPSIFFVPHYFWPWATVLLASQRRRMRLFSLAPQTQPSLLGKLIRRMVPILIIDQIEDLLPGGNSEEMVRHAIARGISVALFCSKKSLSEQVGPFIKAWKSERIMRNIPCFSITIPKGEEKADKPWASARINLIDTETT